MTIVGIGLRESRRWFYSFLLRFAAAVMAPVQAPSMSFLA